MMTVIKPVPGHATANSLPRKPHAVTQLMKALDSKGYNTPGSAGEMKLANATVYRWIGNDVVPDPASIKKIYRFLELIGFDTEPAPPDEDIYLATLRKERQKKKSSGTSRPNKPLTNKERLAKLEATVALVQQEAAKRNQQLADCQQQINRLGEHWLTTIHAISSRFPDFRESFDDIVKEWKEDLADNKKGNVDTFPLVT